MSRRYEYRPQQMRQLVATTCDGCGVNEKDSEFGRLAPVVIEVDEGEEGGGRDEYDYCDACLVERAPLLAAAGSKAPLVTGVDSPEEPQ